MSHIPFNRPFVVGKELFYISQAVINGNLAGDGQFTKQCNNWMERKFKAKKVLLTTSCTAALEITDVNREYMLRGVLQVQLFRGGFTWLDTGTHESLLEASTFVETIEKRQGQKIACIKEIAYRMGYVNAEQLQRLPEPLKNNEYGEYLLGVVGEDIHRCTEE